MRIIKIEIDKTSKGITPDDHHTLYPVDVTFKSFWGYEAHKMLYPTLIARCGKNGDPLFFHYCNEFGERLEDEISEQINKFLFINTIFN